MSLMQPQAAAAQSTGHNPAAPVCAEGSQPETRSETVVLEITAGVKWKERHFTDAGQRTILYYADAIRKHFTPPSSLGAIPTVAEMDRTDPGDVEGASSILGGRLVLIARPNGRVREMFWEELPMATPVARAVFAAAAAADSAHEFEGMPRIGDAGDDTIVVRIQARRDADDAVLPLMRATVSSYIADQAPQVLKAANLVFPTSAGRAGVGSPGRARFVIGSDGKAIMSTLQITRVDWRDFIPAMTKWVERTTFSAAMSRGCAVPALVAQEFGFTVNRP